MSEEATTELDSAPQDSNDFMSSIDDDLRNEPSLADIKDINSLAKGFVNAQKMVGSSIRIPSEDAGKEDWDKFYSKFENVPGLVSLRDGQDNTAVFRRLGTPEDADGYSVDLGEGVDTSLLDSFKPVALEANLTKEQFAKVAEFRKAELTRETEAYTAKASAAQEALKSKWGPDYEVRLQGAKAALDLYAEQFPEAVEDLKRPGSDGGINPVVIAMLSDMYAASQEKGGLEGTASGPKYGITPEDAQAQIAEIRANKDHPFYHATHPDNRAAAAKMQKLYKIVYPD